MSDEKPVKYIVHADGHVPDLEAGAAETARLTEEQPQQPQRGSYKKRILKGILKVSLVVLAINLMLILPAHREGDSLFSPFGVDRLAKWWKDCGGMGGEHSRHGGDHAHGLQPFAPVRRPGLGHPVDHRPSRPYPMPVIGADQPFHRPLPKPLHGAAKPHRRPTRPYPMPLIGANKMTKPFRGAAKWNKPLAHINPGAMSALVNGKLPATMVDFLFSSGDRTCTPTIPVEGLEKSTFNATEFNKIVHRVVGNIGTDIHVESTTEPMAFFEVRALVSDPEVAEDIKLSETRSEDGEVVFQLTGPKWLGQGKCAHAAIVLRVPETVTDLVALRSSFVYGKYKLSKKLAHSIKFGDFEVNTAVGDIVTPPIYADNVVINTVSGNIHGHYLISSSASVHSVSGKIDIGVNVRKADRSSITAESVSGAVDVRVSGGFAGSFTARTINGEVEVEDVSDGSNRLHFDKDLRRVKTGTYGPENDSRAGESVLRAAVINGDVSVEFE
ncbi:hypothetical protein GGI04_000143 [Coemansia thaxteri]|nr:hypothetical protein GGI04_000143 [Coemansia thaxteri]KAJ2469286.1 hypothetical protein GGI02_003435 [Coemansia sp. RSA 2322]